MISEILISFFCAFGAKSVHVPWLVLGCLCSLFGCMSWRIMTNVPFSMFSTLKCLMICAFEALLGLVVLYITSAFIGL